MASQEHHHPGADTAVDELITALLEIDGSRSAFMHLLDTRPQVLGADVEEKLAEMGRTPRFGRIFEHFAALVRDSHGDPAGAWETFEGEMAAATALGRELEQADREIEAAIADGRRRDALDLIEAAIEKGMLAGLSLAVAELHRQAGEVLIGGGIAERDDEVERAIAHFKQGLEFAGPPEQAAGLLMCLGLAGPERVRGDRRENVDQGVHILRQALEVLGDAQPGELDAQIRTNLASVLLARETDDPVGNLTQARQLVERALGYRSPERNPEDWAYSQLNLGLILDRLAREGEVEPEEAVAAWQAVIDRSDACAPYLVGHAHHGWGQQILDQAQPNPLKMTEEELEARDNLDPDPELLSEARDHLREARTLLEDAPNQLARGRALNDLAQALTLLGETDESMAVGWEALELLGPAASPRDCVAVTYRLGTQLADSGRFEAAADVFRAGVAAAEIAIDTRLDAADRGREAQRAGNIARWASYCVAQVGEPVEAALILENGRTRELRRRLGPDVVTTGVFDDLPEELRRSYLTARDNLASARLDGGESNASRALQEVLYEIREHPGFEAFGAGTDAAGLRRAVEPGWPLLYVNPTPWGTLLILALEKGDDLQLVTEFLDATSLQVFLRLLIGDAADGVELNEDSDARSYLFGISTPEERNLREDMEQALPWLGHRLAQPIAGFLAAQGVAAVSIVICGPLGAAPLHAAAWDVDAGVRCLLDDVDVRFAPSAVVLGSVIDRARAAHELEPQLLALAFPGEHGELVAAIPEAREIAKRFPPDRRVVFEGRHASSVNLLDHAGAATHVHLACHADAGLFEAEESTVILADREVPALALTSLVGLRTRLVSVSACRSAMAEIANLADEVMSFGTAVLAAGSACVIATLWPVDDAAAALCMVRTYEELDQPDTTPPQALRRAQLWLRDLTDQELDRYLAAHPALEAEFRRRHEAGDSPGRRGPGSGSPAGAFSHPDYWACFIASGV